MGRNPGQNDNRFDDMMKQVRVLGSEAALGRDSLPKLAMTVLNASIDGVISLDKDSEGQDDAAKIYAEYVKADSKKAIHDHSANGKKANVSKLRQIVTMGSKTTCEPLTVMENGIKLRKELEAAEQKVKPVYPSMVDIARKQNEQDDALNDDQLREAVLKPDPKAKEEATELTRASKILDGLITGETLGTAVTDPDVIAAHASIQNRLAALQLAQDKAELEAKARSLGVTIVPNPAHAAAVEAICAAADAGA
jgi:hypothetical protein